MKRGREREKERGRKRERERERETERQRERETIMPLCKDNVERCNLLARKKILK